MEGDVGMTGQKRVGTRAEWMRLCKDEVVQGYEQCGHIIYKAGSGFNLRDHFSLKSGALCIW